MLTSSPRTVVGPEGTIALVTASAMIGVSAAKGTAEYAALVAALQAGGIEFASRMEQIVVPPEQAMGATIVFT